MKLYSCSNCFQTKPETEFYPKRWRGYVGRQSRCKACNAEVVRGYTLRKKERLRRERWDRIYGRRKESA